MKIKLWINEKLYEDDVKVDDNKKAEFTKRLEYIQSICEQFINQQEGKIQMYKNQQASTDEEKQAKTENIRKYIEASKTGRNVRRLCNVLLSSNPLSDKGAPKSPSWKKYKRGVRFNSRKRQNAPRRGASNRNNRGTRGGRNDSNRRRDSFGFNRSSSRGRQTARRAIRR